ncbi:MULTISPECIES: DUF4296 domain-containing protein [Chryseobacterium]|uniref:DUF4296 domain-containing protein n=1 Tax=Chryseobacterium taihuense TaxID=1141221 RepID=A0A1G9KXR9_9FLAO|nr:MULTISPECIES: DUF4296 domain-containing protein [Chryseobacterium]QQV02798.1 DUF4296 domain-containing protein [Chryseobacterium sp. FDAARGOS 1104]SDL54518.1 protein of unknown function [Chryseobacterium taihuense]VFB03930.1 Uncharacterised protein [Chryseobacterium taihuense]
MKKLIGFFIFLFVFSCTEYIDKPENLIGQDKMAEIIAEMAINDQIIFLYPDKNLESGTRYILKSYNIKADDFVESYKYYVIKQKMKGIVEDAQEILKEKDPKAVEKVKKASEQVINDVPRLERR